MSDGPASGGAAASPESPPAPSVTDDAFTVEPRAATVKAYVREGVDRLLGADPGGFQLRTAIRAAGGIALAVGLVYLFVSLTGALQLPPGSAPAEVVQRTNHGLLIVAMLVAGMIAMMAGMMVNDETVRGQLVSTLLLPVVMLLALVLGFLVGFSRPVALIWLILAQTGAVYARRFGPRGNSLGIVFFNGSFLGFFLHAELKLSQVGWLAADLGIGILASLIVRFVFVRPDPVAALDRMRHSWQARSRRVLAETIDVLDAAEETGEASSAGVARAGEQLRRQMVRLNEATLMVDAELVVATPATATAQAQNLFDAELALSNCARFASALPNARVGLEPRRTTREALAALRDSDWERARRLGRSLCELRGPTARATVLLHRLGESIAQAATANQNVQAIVDARARMTALGEYRPAAQLNAGVLPGSAPVANQASTTPGRGGFLDRATLPTYTRAAIQMAVASTLAVLIGGLVSNQRLYWAVLATFLAFMATTNSGEQVRKALFRLSGTAIGIVIGDVFVHATNAQVWPSLIIVLVSLFLGIYLIRINYTFMVIGITVTMALLYAQLGEFSWSLLTLRLAETAVGVGVVALTVVLIVPLRPQRVLTAGALLWFREFRALLDASLNRLTGVPPTPADPADPDSRPPSMLELIRDQDAAYASLEATAAPLRSATFGRKSAQLAEIRSVSAAARNYSRSLASEADAVGHLDNPTLVRAAAQLKASAEAIEKRIETGETKTFTRSAALFEVASRSLPPGESAASSALRDLTLLDGTLARLAAALQMEVTDFDTSTAGRVRTAPSAVSRRGR